MTDRFEYHFRELDGREATSERGVGMRDEEFEASCFEQICLGNGIKRHRRSLVKLYLSQDEPQKAEAHLVKMLSEARDAEERAQCYLLFGQTMESKGDFHAAAGFYGQALSFEPRDPHTAYQCQSSLAYALVQTKNYIEAEAACRWAYDLDPSRPEALKNLGLALKGQDRLREAALSFAEAVDKDATDYRALHHFQQLLIERPELLAEFGDRLRACEEAALSAAREWRRHRREHWPMPRVLPTDAAAVA